MNNRPLMLSATFVRNVNGLFSGISGSQWPDEYLLPVVDLVRDTYLIGRADEIPPSVFAAAETAHAEDFDFWEKTLSAYVMAGLWRQHRGHTLVRQRGFALD